MPTITAISPDGQQRMHVVREENIAKEVKIMQNQGLLQIRVTRE
jgi:hypothetical protein